MKVRYDIPYTEADDGRLIDLFIPDRHQPSRGLCLLFIHGGGWSGGNKEQFHSLAEYFCSIGYVCASISYRLSGKSIFPAQIEDARLGIAYLKRHAEHYAFDPGRIVAFGSSAGGHLALMLALIPPGDSLGNSPQLDIDDTRPYAVIAYCPVTDLKREKLSYAQLMGATFADAREMYISASPIDRPQPECIPMLIINGDADTTTPVEASEAYCRKVRKSGGEARLVVLPGVKHGFGYGSSTDAQKTAIRHVEQFLIDIEMRFADP